MVLLTLFNVLFLLVLIFRFLNRYPEDPGDPGINICLDEVAKELGETPLNYFLLTVSKFGFTI